LALAELNVPDVIISDYRLLNKRTCRAIAAVRALLGSLSALLITGTLHRTSARGQGKRFAAAAQAVSASKLYASLSSCSRVGLGCTDKSLALWERGKTALVGWMEHSDTHQAI